jgi:hypothetical protein
LDRRFNPLATVARVGTGKGGADDIEVRGIVLVGTLQDCFERGPNALAPAGVEAGGMDLAVGGTVIGDVVITGKLFGTPPAKEVLLDGVAFGMRTNLAPAPVAH